MFKSNCLKCGSIRSVELDKGTNQHICMNCGAIFYISTRKKVFYPDSEVQKILSKADKWRAKACYDNLKGDLFFPEGENVRNTIERKIFRFRKGTGYLIEEEGIVYFFGKVKIGEDKKEKFKIKTNVSIEEYKLYCVADPEKTKEIKISPHPPYNLFIQYVHEKNQRKITHHADVGVDVNFPIIVAAISIDGNGKEIYSEHFPERKLRNLLKKANKAQSEKNLQRKSMFHNIIKRITKGNYYHFIESVHKEVRKTLELKTNKKIKYTWHIENPTTLRNLHSQFHHQAWKPTILMKCLEEKQKKMYLEINEINPAYTSKKCSKCGIINKEFGSEKIFKCKKCGFTMNRDENAALNILLLGMSKEESLHAS